MSMESRIVEMAQAARNSSQVIANCTTVQKNKALLAIADLLDQERTFIQTENHKDLTAGREAGLSEAMLDRLALKDGTITSIIQGLQEVARLNDPVGAMETSWLRPNGLQVGRMRIPLGVVGIIYESRPNVTVDAAALCLKAGNAVILRGGSEALASNQALSEIIGQALTASGLPREIVQVIPTTDRAAINILLQQEAYVDLIIPRGGEGLIRFVCQNSTIPVLKHFKGVCHVFVDADADLEMAEEICFNAKVQRPGVCNAMETLLIHQATADTFLPRIAARLQSAGVTLRGCERTCAMVAAAQKADQSDWEAEYLDLTLAVRIVDDMPAAISHITQYGSQHTEAIVTNNYGRARQFVRQVDASAVVVNASTRFNDGGELGLGAEIGISTSKLHAFGPMGVDELTTTKFVVFGEGQIRQ